MSQKNRQVRFILLFIIFFIVLIAVGNIIVKRRISPQLVETEVRNIKLTAEAQSIIKAQITREPAQQRAISESVRSLPQ
ncbi:hypothetical protein A9798_03830 [Edwardsiella hoshinae]|uniref:Uncharacterized protein n=1 Tax=Edwardsiella hoshinae TaxID=93378 RepID=A0A376DAF4_9GAMM|nr:hypothetical protein [Edwardsiella hoshinae]AOV96162.1 hypothetical protein A9798_03830 [Edwardsiella hoshinae]QPR27957.1 hypothetical protein I6G97_16460 [Edwardsiella hoshinae]STC85428.1 Uncharacterised protein [Edwardsiella hoshinae]